MISHAPCNQASAAPLIERACWSPSRNGNLCVGKHQVAGKPTHRCANFSDAVDMAGRTHVHVANQHAAGESKQYIGALRGQVAAVGLQDLRTVQDRQEGIGPPARRCR